MSSQKDSTHDTHKPAGGGEEAAAAAAAAASSSSQDVPIKQERAAEVVRAPLAVPMAHQGGRSAGFAAMPRLGSLRATPDLSLGAPTGAPKPAFAPLIPNARSHSRKMFVFLCHCSFLTSSCMLTYVNSFSLCM